MSDSSSDHSGSIQSSLLFGYDFNCDHCARNEVAEEAIGYCEDCREYLCTNCYTVHTIPTPSEDHITILLNTDLTSKDTGLYGERRSESTETLTDSCTEMCPKHPNYILELYCNDHKDIGCSTCMKDDHPFCYNIEEISEVSKTIDSNQVQELTDKMDIIKNSSKSMINNTQTNITKTEKNHAKIVKDAHQFVERVVKKVYAMEQDFIKHSEKIKNENIARLSQVMDEYSEAFEQCQQMVSEMKDLENSYKTCKLFVHMKKTEKKVLEIQEHLNDINSNNRSTLYKFKPDRSIIEIISETSQTDLGSLQERDSIGHYMDSHKFETIYIRSGKDRRKCITRRQSHKRPKSWAAEMFLDEEPLGTIPEGSLSSDA